MTSVWLGTVSYSQLEMQTQAQNYFSHLVDGVIVTEDDHTNVVCLQVECHTLHTALEANKLTGLHRRKRGNILIIATLCVCVCLC